MTKLREQAGLSFDYTMSVVIVSGDLFLLTWHVSTISSIYSLETHTYYVSDPRNKLLVIMLHLDVCSIINQFVLEEGIIIVFPTSGLFAHVYN